MAAKVEILRQKSLIFGSTQGSPGGCNYDLLECSGGGNTPVFPPLMVGLVMAFMVLALGISNARAAVGAHTEDASEGHRIHPSVLDDQISTQVPEGGLLPADRELALALAAAADARAAAAPLRDLPTDKRHELATMEPAKPSDLTIGLRFTSPIYLAFFSLPTAPDPMPVPNIPQPIWPGLGVVLLMAMMTVVTLTSWTNPAFCTEDR